MAKRESLGPANVKVPSDLPLSMDLSLRLKTALGHALKKTALNGKEVAAQMSALLGEAITSDQLYAWTAASKPKHQIKALQLIAFIRVTGQAWVLQVLIDEDGLAVLDKRDARLAEIGRLALQRRAIDDQLRKLGHSLDGEPGDA